MERAEYIETLYLGEYGEYLNDYRSSDTYICDAISEIADNHTSIYYSDILEFIKEHSDYVNEAVDELGWPGDIYRAGQYGECRYIEEDIYSNLEDSIKLMAADYIYFELELQFTDDIIELIDEVAAAIDNNDRCSAINELIDEKLAENAA